MSSKKYGAVPLGFRHQGTLRLFFTASLFVLIIIFPGCILGQQKRHYSAEYPPPVQDHSIGLHKLQKAGLSIATALTTDMMGSISGGLKQKAVFVENWDISLNADLNHLIGWKGSLVHLSLLQNNGGQPSRFIGDIQTADNIEAVKTVRVYEGWIQQDFLENHGSVLFGIYDVNSEFDNMQSAALFINSSQGLGGELAASGLNGPPTFPATALSGRLKIAPDPSCYFAVNVSDGVPGIKHAEWSVNRNEGLFGIAEAGFLINESNIQDTEETHISRTEPSDYLIKIAIGGWGYSRNYVGERNSINFPGRKNEKGIYFLTDVRSFSWLNDKLKKLSWHIRAGLADNELSRIHYYMGSGLSYSGLIPFDASGTAGFSVSAVDNSSIYNQQNSLSNTPPEVTLEGTYQTTITPWLAIQPDVQYIIHPGGLERIHNAWVLGLRSIFMFGN